jgi:hypothetical protein
VPLPVGVTAKTTSATTIDGLATDLGAFVTKQATNNSIFSIGIFGWTKTGTITPTKIAKAVNNSRVIVAYPNQLTYYNGYSNTVQTLSGYYLAACYAGILASHPVQTGLTKKQVRNFSGIPPLLYQKMTMTQKNTWSSSGVAVTELTGNGTLQCRHGVTSNPSSVYTREISLVRTQDFMVESLIAAFDNATLIGSPITPNTIPAVTSIVTNVLQSLVTRGVIFSFAGVSVVQQSLNPTIVKVTFSYIPAYPLNYITFSFSIDKTTGKVQVGTTSAGTPTT